MNDTDTTNPTTATATGEATTGKGDRVRQHTRPEVNRRIDTALERNLHYYGAQPRSAMDARIRALDDEWDIERTLQVNAATLALGGVLAGMLVDRRWLVLPGVVLGFLLMHGLQGWCPPLPLFRRAGVRTRREIDREKFALKFLRGDFEHLDADSDAEQATVLRQAVER